MSGSEVHFNLAGLPEDRPNLEPIKDNTATPQISVLDPKSRIGYHLARIVLAMIGAFLIFLILYILLNLPAQHSQLDYKSLSNLPDSVLSNRLTIIKTVQADEKESRDFVIQISQMVLLNILLPILTAILGYIFGSHSESKG